jgi:nucleotide-binding universal stress UspA family protein
MRVIIAYDGSSDADAAIAELSRAGLPRDSEVLVVSVADFSVATPTLSEFDLVSAASTRMEAVLTRVRQRKARLLKETRAMVSEVVHRLRPQFPDWTVNSEVMRGTPAEELLRKVREWNADLIMGGSQGRSAIGRFFLGSVSKSVAERADCSVRVVRHRNDKADTEPSEIILAAKSPVDAERIVEAVSQRVWRGDTRMRLVAVDDGFSRGRVSAFYSDGKSIYESIAQRLAASGAQVSVQLENGDPKAVLLGAADIWKADAIFIVAQSGDNATGLDEAASGLITTAKCTVEIVRSARGRTTS